MNRLAGLQLKPILESCQIGPIYLCAQKRTVQLEDWTVRVWAFLRRSVFGWFAVHD